MRAVLRLLISLLFLYQKTSGFKVTHRGIRSNLVRTWKTLGSSDSSQSNKDLDEAPQQQMCVIPYEDEDAGTMFAREDLPLDKIMGQLSNKGQAVDSQKRGEKISKLKGSGVPKIGGNRKTVEERLQESYVKNLNRPREGGWIENPNRNTGYGIPDENDNETEMQKKMEDDMASGKYVPDDSVPDGYMDEFLRFLRNTYIGSPYDSRKKQQARYVIRNITGISVAIGVVFTIIWYASPVKFISTAQDREARYQDTDYYRAPNGLMNDDLKSRQIDLNGYIDEGAPTPVQTRFDGFNRPKNNDGAIRAPMPSVDL